MATPFPLMGLYEIIKIIQLYFYHVKEGITLGWKGGYLCLFFMVPLNSICANVGGYPCIMLLIKDIWKLFMFFSNVFLFKLLYIS